MNPLATAVDRLLNARDWSYGPAGASATEPAAWACMALVAQGEAEAAVRPAAWLANVQQPSGPVGIASDQAEPHWPTALALLAWKVVDSASEKGNFKKNIERAVRWALAARGKEGIPSPLIGHDTSLVGWPWAAGTHSWLEPTCLCVLALTAAGQGEHPRVQEGMRMIVDRLLPDGGANYGNTIVLGQPLLPHIEPTGLAMLALATSGISDVRIGKSLDYLRQAAAARISPASLSYAVLGLTAHNRRPEAAHDLIARALAGPDAGTTAAGPLNVYELSLLLAAAVPDLSWLPIGSPLGLAASISKSVQRELLAEERS